MIRKSIRNLAITSVAVLSIVACSTTPTPYSQSKKVSYFLQAANSLDEPGVMQAIEWLSVHAELPGYYDYSAVEAVTDGAHADIVMELVKRRGAAQFDWIGGDGIMAGVMAGTPFDYGNAFQAAIASARPSLAKRIAIHHAKLSGDYQDGVPLGAIPSIHSLAVAVKPRSESRHFRYYDNARIKSINKVLPDNAYTDPPGRGLLFRYAIRVINVNLYEFQRHYKIQDLDEVRSGRTWTKGGNGAYADEFAEFHIQRQLDTTKFIYENFGGDPNEALPYCFPRKGTPIQMCGEFTATQLAARTMNKRSVYLSGGDREDWLQPGKLNAMIAIGGNPNKKDAYGNDAFAMARYAGKFPGDAGKGIDFGQIMAGAVVVAGSAYMANAGAYDQAAQFLAGGLTDVVTGSSDNIVRMALREQKKAAEADAAVQQQIRTLRNSTYITPETWAANSLASNQKPSSQVNQSSPTQGISKPSYEGFDPGNQAQSVSLPCVKMPPSDQMNNINSEVGWDACNNARPEDSSGTITQSGTRQSGSVLGNGSDSLDSTTNNAISNGAAQTTRKELNRSQNEGGSGSGSDSSDSTTNRAISNGTTETTRKEPKYIFVREISVVHKGYAFSTQQEAIDGLSGTWAASALSEYCNLQYGVSYRGGLVSVTELNVYKSNGAAWHGAALASGYCRVLPFHESYDRVRNCPAERSGQVDCAVKAMY